MTVGIFSLFGSRKDGDPEADGAAGLPPAKIGTGSPPSAPAAAGAAAGTPASHTPFTPPEAWNIDALTAPPPEPTEEAAEVGPVDRGVTADLQPRIVDALKTVYDPEIPVDIYELGLIYEIIADAERKVLVRMTLTSPACPSAQQLPSEVRYKVKALPGVTNAWVEIVWEPPWSKDRMSEAAKLSLGFF